MDVLTRSVITQFEHITEPMPIEPSTPRSAWRQGVLATTARTRTTVSYQLLDFQRGSVGAAGGAVRAAVLILGRCRAEGPGRAVLTFVVSSCLCCAMLAGKDPLSSAGRRGGDHVHGAVPDHACRPNLDGVVGTLVSLG